MRPNCARFFGSIVPLALATAGLAGLVPGCSSAGAELAADDGALTSVTARTRDLQFDGYVYVDEKASDATILQTVRKQTQSAFGALRTAEIGVSSRELKEVDPTSFRKTVVTVRDAATPDAPGVTKLRVAYTYKDSAVLPIKMAKRSAVSIALLTPGYEVQANRILKECTSGDEEAQEFIGSIWYVFDPSVSSCTPAMSKEQDQIKADAALLKLKDGEITKSELSRLYIPVNVKLGADRTNKGRSYPEYDRLFSGGIQKGTLTIGMVNGFIDHDAKADESDLGYEEWIAQISGSMAGATDWKVVSTEPSADLFSYSVGGKTVTFASFDELASVFNWNAHATIQGVATADLRAAIGKATIRHWITFEREVRVSIGDQPAAPVKLQLKTFFGAGASDVAVHKRMLKASDVYIYNGHSLIGYGPLDPSNFKASDFPSSYQIMFVDGCVSYNYYNKDYVPLKEGGTQNLDLITNGLEAPAGSSGEAIGRFVSLLFKGSAPYRDLLKAAISTDNLRVVDGEVDNAFDPAKTPIRFEK